MAELKLTLAKPAQGHHGQITEVVFREPTPKEVFTYDSPYQTFGVPGSDRVEIKTNPKESLEWLLRLCNEPEIFPDCLTLAQCNQAKQWLVNIMNSDGSDTDKDATRKN